MPPKKICPTSVAELPEVARQAKTWPEFRSAMTGQGCTPAQVGTFWKQVNGEVSTLKKRKADEVELENPSPKKTLKKLPSPKKPSPKKASPKASPKAAPSVPTPKTTKTPRKTIVKAKVATPKKASPKAATPKAATPKAATPKKPSPKNPTPKKAASPLAVETAAFALACYADGVDWSKCLDDEQHGEKCAKSLRKKFPDLFECPSCPKKQSSAEAVKETAGAPPPPPPPPPPMPKKTAAALKEVTQKFTGASSLVSDKKGIVGMMSGVTLKKVDPSTPRPAFQAMPIVAQDSSIKQALADAPNATAAERAKLGQVAEATDFLSEIMSKKLNKVAKTEKSAAAPTPSKFGIFEQLKQGTTLRKTEGPGKSTFKKDQFAGNDLMSALSKRMGNIRAAFEEPNAFED